MATLDPIIRRNIELETELRIAKEQLSQAQQGTSLLAQCFSAQQTQVQYDLKASNEFRIQELELQNRLLRMRLARITDDGASGLGPSELNDRDLLETCRQLQQQDPRVLGGLRASTEAPIEDLLDIEDDNLSCSLKKEHPIPLTNSAPSIPRSILKPYSAGLSVSSSDIFQPEYLVSNEVESTVPETKANHWTAIRESIPSEPGIAFSNPFHEGEHGKLRAMANWIESYSANEKVAYFEKLANKRHSAEEWRRYYEIEVRPKFLAIYGPGEVESRACSLPRSAKSRTRSRGQGARESSDVMDMNGLSGSKWVPTRIRGRAEVPKSLNPLVDAHKLSEVDSSPVEQNTDQIQGLTPDSDSLPTHHEEARIPENEGEFGKGDLLSGSPRQVVGVAPEVPLQPLGLPDTIADTVHRPDREMPVRGRSQGRSRGRRRARDASLNGAGALYRYNSTHPDLLRTIVITNIPITVTLATVLSKVRGGKIVRAEYIDTAGMKTLPPIVTNTALIKFLNARDAAAFARCAEEHPIFLHHGNDLASTALAVELVKTPTRPLPAWLYSNIYHHGLTRVLFIIDAEQKWGVKDIVEQLQYRKPELSDPIRTGRTEHDVLYFEFADVREAGEAFDIVHCDGQFFQGASKGFWPDPCDRSERTIEDQDESQESELDADGQGMEKEATTLHEDVCRAGEVEDAPPSAQVDCEPEQEE